MKPRVRKNIYYFADHAAAVAHATDGGWPTAVRLAPKKWVGALCTDGETKPMSSLEWVTRAQAKNEAAGWLLMLQRSGRA